ncbi:hypothetical protein JOS77_26855 [Chromobacterium haemolyticum]|nr:hypothetical protein JOS77_26855 [Chromobacterium haemolyticum]
MVRAFPAPIRFSGLSFSYNVAYAVVGGFTPVLLSVWMEASSLALAGYLMIFCLLGLAMGLFLLAWGDKPGLSHPVH